MMDECMASLLWLTPNTSGILVPMVSLPGGFLDIFVQKLAYDFNGFHGNSVLVLHCTAKFLKIPVLDS